MKFGDIVENTAAGRKNPQRILMFVCFSGEFAKFLSTVGEDVKFLRSDVKEGFLVLTGKRVDFSEWKRLLKAATIDPAAAGKGGA